MKIRSAVHVAATVAALLVTTPAVAYFPHGVAPTAPTAPILQAVSVPYGNQTRTAHGPVRLNSPSITTTSIKPQTYPGLGLMTSSGPACETWTLTYVSNTSGRPGTDFTLPSAGVAEGTSAITPIVSATGQGNLVGTYTWSAQCVGNGQSSNAVSFQYVIDNAGGAGAVMFGEGDRVDFGATPSGFGNTAGAKVLFPVGADFHATDLSQLRFATAFTNQVLFTPADTARRPYMTNIGIAGGMSNVRVYDFVLSGAMPGGTNVVVKAVATNSNTLHDILFEKISYFGAESMLGNTNPAASAFGNCTSNCVLLNSYFEYIDSAVGSASNSAVRGNVFRYIYNNAVFLGNSTNFELSDNMFLSPMQKYPGGAHPDMMQVADGATPGPGYVFLRNIFSQADGDYFGQGPYFSGTYTALTGYVSAGAGDTNPGNVFTPVPSGTRLGVASNGSTIVINGSVAATDGITLSCSTAQGCTSASSIYTLTGLAATNIGSAGSPVTMYGAGEQGFQISGLMSTQAGPYGQSSNGQAGTSWLYDFDYVNIDAQNPLTATFDGEIIAGVLNVYNTATSNRPNEIAAIVSPGGACCTMGRLAYVGCNYCGTIPIARLSGTTDFGPGTYSTTGSAGLNVARQTMTLTGAFPGIAGAHWSQQNCNKPGVFSGTNNVDRGVFPSGYIGVGSPGGSCVNGVNFPATGTTIGSHAFGPTISGWYAPGGGTLTGADYASGVLPEVYLAAHPYSASDTPADIAKRECLARKPSLGGKRDAGSGLGYASVTPETNAVTHTGGGDWMIFNGTSHVASTHIPGCELAP